MKSVFYPINIFRWKDRLKFIELDLNRLNLACLVLS